MYNNINIKTGKLNKFIIKKRSEIVYLLYIYLKIYNTLVIKIFITILFHRYIKFTIYNAYLMFLSRNYINFILHEYFFKKFKNVIFIKYQNWLSAVRVANQINIFLLNYKNFFEYGTHFKSIFTIKHKTYVVSIIYFLLFLY